MKKSQNRTQIQRKQKNKNKLTVITALCVIMMMAAAISGCTSQQSSDNAAENAATETTPEEDNEDNTGAEVSDNEDTDAETEISSEEESTVVTDEATQEQSEEDTEEEAVKSTEEGKRRILPHEEKTAEEESAYPAADEIEGVSGKIEGPSVMFVEKKSVVDTKVKGNKAEYPDSEEDVEALLKDLSSYWKDYNLDAVDYLVRMEKYRYLSQLLEGTNDFFYYGEENENGDPNGIGIKVYAGNQYYYGSFTDGKREGDGFWYQIFVRNGIYSKANNGIVSHSYRGEWAADLPNGEGQEHIDFDTAYMTGRTATNVIGSFINGYYNGEELVTTIDESEGSFSWKGTAINGTWVPFDKGLSGDGTSNSQIPILENTERSGNYFWMLEKENKGQGITGLIR